MNMEQKNTDVEAALAAIASASLTPTEHLLLKSFVKEAVDPSYAALHILQILDKHPNLSAEEVLRDLKQDWRRLVVKCEPSNALLTCIWPVISYFVSSRRCRGTLGREGLSSQPRWAALLHASESE